MTNNTNTIHSMTAYTSSQSDFASFGRITCEIKSVNSRFLDLYFKLPEYLSYLEPNIRSFISNKLSRGKVDISLYIKLDPEFKANNLYNKNIKEYLDLYNNIKSISNSNKITNQDLNISEVIKYLSIQEKSNNVNSFNPIEYLDNNLKSELDKNILNLLENAISDLISQRAKEGNTLQDVLINILNNLKSDVAILEELLPQASLDLKNKFMSKLSESIKDLSNTVNSSSNSAGREANIDLGQDLEIKVAQEVAVYLNKVDISEELARLKLHIDEVECNIKNINNNTVVGRRLDFLMQELMRETNTLSAKAVNIDFRNTAINLKVYIEQMREQIQNIE